MTALLVSLFTFPTIIFSIPMILVLLYWLMVMLGALDVELFHSADGVDGAIHGSLKGAAEGIGESAAHGVGEAAGHLGGGHGEALDGIHGHHHGLFWDFLSVLKLTSGPITVVMSLFVFWNWFACSLTMQLTQGMLHVNWSRWLIGTLVLVCSLVFSLLMTSISVRPLERFFIVHQATSKQELVGKVVTIKTTYVDQQFGQGLMEDGGASLLLHVRTDGKTSLKLGEKALIVSYMPAKDTFLVESMANVMDESSDESPSTHHAGS
jgi:hypothetical protein